MEAMSLYGNTGRRKSKCTHVPSEAEGLAGALSLCVASAMYRCVTPSQLSARPHADFFTVISYEVK